MLLQGGNLRLQRRDFQRPARGGGEPRGLHRLDEVVEGAAFMHSTAISTSLLPVMNDDGELRIPLLQLRQQLPAGEVGHGEIDDHRGRLALLEETASPGGCPRRPRRGRSRRRAAPPGGKEELGVVVHQQDRGIVRRRSGHRSPPKDATGPVFAGPSGVPASAAGRRTIARVPFPTSDSKERVPLCSLRMDR